MMKGLEFKQIVTEATNIFGNCIDHVYITNEFKYKCLLHYPYYTDHEAVCVMLEK